jgi:cell division protein FtsN
VEATRQDKRSIVRRRTPQLVYLELGKENGGVMLNLSEHGCGFQAITPVKCGETHFGFQINGGRRIAGDAEVVWADDAGVMGGLRFLNLPAEAHREIRLWLEETNAPVEHGFAPAAAAAFEGAARRSRAMGTEEAPAPIANARVAVEEPPVPPAWANLRAGAYPPIDDGRYGSPYLGDHRAAFGNPHRKSAEARQQVRDWTSQAAPALSFDDASSRPVPTLRAFPGDIGVRPESKAAPLGVASPGRKGLASWSGFSAGLGVGVLVSALVGAAFSFHTYRRQFGASIIQFGERVAEKPQVQPQMASPVVQPELPATLAVSTPATPISIAQQSESLIPQPSRNAPAPQPLPAPHQTKSEPLAPDTAWRVAVGSSRPKAPTANGSTLISETPPPVSFPTIIVAPKSYLVPSKLGPAPPLAPASEPNVHSVVSGKEDAGSPSEMYLEVGKFKDQPPASEVKDKLATLGFPASVTQKGRFWGNSYYVLVGPYDNDREAKAAHKSLTSRGFKPRAFERGSRAFAFSYVLTLNGARMPVGDYSIRWESYSSLVIVEFMQNNDIVATVDGKWAKRDTPYDRGAYAFTRYGDGSRNLVWIQFAGMRRTLIFEKSS